jgi:tellurite resistance protein TerC
MFGEVAAWEWAVFGGIVALLVGIDLFVHRGARAESRRWAIIWTGIWVVTGLAFTGYVWQRMGGRAAEEYLAAYLIEKSLSLDNLFVFLIIFRMLAIPREHQRTALSWGVFGALVFRAAFVFLGARALEQWAWVEYIFAAILLFAAWHAWREDPAREQRNRLVLWLERHLAVGHEPERPKFLVREGGRRKATPLLVAVIALELTDILFAIDSVPAAFAITRNEFIIYSSNVFAILGLRSLYIVLAHTIATLRHLHYGLAGILAFAATKMLLPHSLEVSPLASVGIILAILAASVWASLRVRPPSAEAQPHAAAREGHQPSDRFHGSPH